MPISGVILEPKINTIGPSESILVGILSSTGRRVDVYHVVLFHHLTSFFENLIIVGHPPLFQLFRGVIEAIIAEANVGKVLQWGPSIWKVPLLSALMKRRNHSPSL